VDRVIWKDRVEKQLERIPSYIRDKFYYWVDMVEKYSISEARKVKGFHDEPLKGCLSGRRSVRLNRAYRLIYRFIGEKIEIQKIEVLEITKHEYKK
jgi:proteic killer suppression protein